MARLFRDCPQALESTLEIAERCRFSLDELRYDYPVQDSYDGRTPDEELARLTWAGAAGALSRPACRTRSSSCSSTSWR